MPSPFPGMDPYLETPHLWPDVHNNLIIGCQAFLNRLIRPNYVARVELRVYVTNEDDPGFEVIIPDARIEKTKVRSGRPTKSNGSTALAIAEPMIMPITIADEIEESRLEITHVKSGSLVTIVEMLSPTNKIRGSEGRKSFQKKRHETLISEVHWVEIDLLRGGAPSIANAAVQASDYRVLVSRAEKRRCFRFWPIRLRAPLPVIGIPLRAPDADAPLDLGAVLSAAYEGAAYDLSVDYASKPEPPLAKDDAKWAEKLLRAKGLR
jgi:hypothetical protein